MVKVILSKKGFDSTTGGAASPIFEGKLLSIPIPRADSNTFYRDIRFDENHSYLKVMKDLNIRSYSEAHLDPDLRKSALPVRPPGWRPMFGQSGAPQAFLNRQGVGVGDIFLFFGWFKEVVQVNGKFRYKYPQNLDKGSDIIFGYLEVGETIDLNTEIAPDWARLHPHVVSLGDHDRPNMLYVATEYFTYDNTKPGGACFKFNPNLKLSKHGETRSVWELPLAFKGLEDYFHPKAQPFEEENGKLVLRYNGRPYQEFFISDNQKVVSWAIDLIRQSEIFD